MKLTNLYLLLIAFTLSHAVSCRQQYVVNKYKYLESSIDDIPKLNSIEGILVANHYHPEMADIMLLVGDKTQIEQITGRQINPEKIVTESEWIKKIYQDYKNAKRVENFGKGSFNDSRVIFITNKKAYMIEFGIDDSDGKRTIVYGDDYVSEQLLKDFEELGLFENEHRSQSNIIQYLQD
jgi:hypothetical protein